MRKTKTKRPIKAEVPRACTEAKCLQERLDEARSHPQYKEYLDSFRAMSLPELEAAAFALQQAVWDAVVDHRYQVEFLRSLPTWDEVTP